MIRSIFSFSLLLWSIVTLSQDRLTGKVVDQSTSEPIPGAVISSSSDTTVTDENGRFSLASAKAINIHFLGYETKTIPNPDSGQVIYLTPSPISLNEVTIKAGLKEEKIKNTAGAISVVSKKMIQRDAPFTITNALNRVPGVYMHSGTYSTNRITIRGIGSRNLFGTNKIKAYYDDIPLTDGSGNSTIEDIDQGLINRVEVLKGPNSSTYGAGLAGVIRLHSYKPEPGVSSVESSLTYGSYNTMRWQNRLSQSNDNQSVSVAYSKVKSNGYRENSSYGRDQVGVTGEWKLGGKSTVSFLGTYTDLKAFIPSALNEDDYQNNPESAAFTWGAAKGYEEYNKFLTGLSFSKEFAAGWELTSAVFYKFRDAYEPRPFNILDEKTWTVGTRNIVNANVGKISLSGGLELFKDQYEWATFENTAAMDGSAKGNRLSDNVEDRTYYNIFAEANFDLTRRFKVIGGLNFNSTSYQLEDQFEGDGSDQSGAYEFDPVLSPRIGLVFHLKPLHHLFVNLSHGFSPPTLEETLYPDGQINPGIQPEKGWNYEIGLRGNFQNLSYDLVGYYMHIKDLLVAQRTDSDQYYGVNAGLNNHYGVDLYLNYLLNMSDKYEINFFSSTSYMHYRFAEFVNEDVNYDGNQLTGVPELLMNTGVELLSESGFYGNINGQYVGEIPITDANSIYADPYFVLRAKVGYSLRLSNWLIDLNAGVDNLLNEKYAGMLLINNTGFGGASPRYYYPGNPRSYFAGVSLKYYLKKKR